MNCHYDPTCLAVSGSAVNPERLECLVLCLMSVKSSKTISSDCGEIEISFSIKLLKP